MIRDRVWWLFHLGLLLPVAVLLRGDLRWMFYLLPIGIAHILLLFAVAAPTGPTQRANAVHTLHKAGFLHTLIGLGGSMLVVGRAAVGPLEPGASVLALALAPMGTVVVPHILGVWLGHAIAPALLPEPALAAIEERLVNRADAAMKLLDTLAATSERLAPRVRQLVTSLDGIATRCATTAQELTGAVATLKTGIGETTNAARDLGSEVNKVASNSDRIANVHRQLVDILCESPLFADVNAGERDEETRQ